MPSSTAARSSARLETSRVPGEGPLAPDQAVVALRRALERGEDWYPALLDTIARWTAPSEEIDGSVQHYLIGGEAFDWLLLAQRLLCEVTDLVPADEVERLVVFGIPPEETDEDEFERAIGAQKYVAHLNFQYGVVVEELLLLSTELEMLKAGRLTGSGQPPPDVQAFEHVYGRPFDELQVLYRSETGELMGARVSQQEYHRFLYWCSKYRMRMMEPARVASDTRKAMALMSRLESGRRRLGRLGFDRRVRLDVRGIGPDA